MGVDYYGASGIGFKIELNEKMRKALEEKYDGDYYDYFDFCLKDTGFSFVQYGNAYSGDIDYAIVVSEKTPLGGIMDEVVRLRKHLVDHGFDLPENEMLTLGDVFVDEMMVS
jgi:hypothetical protein